MPAHTRVAAFGAEAGVSIHGGNMARGADKVQEAIATPLVCAAHSERSDEVAPSPLFWFECSDFPSIQGCVIFDGAWTRCGRARIPTTAGRYNPAGGSQYVESALARRSAEDAPPHVSTADTAEFADCIGDIVAVITMRMFYFKIGGS